MSDDDGIEETRVPGTDGLYADRPPSPELAERVVGELRARGLLRPRPPWRGWVYGVAAGLVLFGAGWMVGRAAPSALLPPEQAYVLLLWEGAEFTEGARASTLTDEYERWARSTRASGFDLLGEEFGDERVVVGAPSSLPPGGDAAIPRVGGYFIVSTAEEEVIRDLAASHPHISHGGWIEVAPVVR